jgi:hypothetical protein
MKSLMEWASVWLPFDGVGKCVVAVRAYNGRIAIAYNEDGFFTAIPVKHLRVSKRRKLSFKCKSQKK